MNFPKSHYCELHNKLVSSVFFVYVCVMSGGELESTLINVWKNNNNLRIKLNFPKKARKIYLQTLRFETKRFVSSIVKWKIWYGKWNLTHKSKFVWKSTDNVNLSHTHIHACVPFSFHFYFLAEAFSISGDRWSSTCEIETEIRWHVECWMLMTCEHWEFKIL